MSKKKAQLSKAERAAAVRREQQHRERRRQFVAVGVIALVLAAIVGVGFLVQSLRDTAGDTAVNPNGASADYSVAIGQSDAPHRVVVYEDFLCPYCREFESQTRDDLARLAGEGKVYVEYRPFNLLSSAGDYSARATNAFAAVLDSAGPEAAKKFHDQLFEQQPGESGPFPDNDWLVSEAVRAGANEADVKSAITEMSFEQWVVNATDAASKAGVNSTPTVLLDGKPVQGQNIDDMAASLVADLG